MANPGNVARGLKGAVNNPNNSQEAKDRAQEKLDQMEQSGEAHSDEAHAAQVKQGHKAAVSNPKTNAQAKEHSQQVLDDM